jgi:hypothetical protein
MARLQVQQHRARPGPGRRPAAGPHCVPIWVHRVTGRWPFRGHHTTRAPANVLARAIPSAAALAGLCVLLAACGGGAPSAGVAHIGSTTTTAAVAGTAVSPASPGDVNAQLDRFVSCMRAHGVPNFPGLVTEPNGGAAPVRPANIDKNSPYVQAARRDCQSVLPSGPPPGPAITPKDQADYIKAAACMRSHGIPNFPDPTFSGNSVRFIAPPGMNATIVNSPQFLRAREICEMLIPAGLPYSKEAQGGQ